MGADLTPYKATYRNYQNAMADKIAGAIVEANSRLKPAHLYGARGTGTININRRFRSTSSTPAAVGRNPEGFVDRDLVVVRIDDSKGKPYAILVNYQCHGTVMGFENQWITPDWVGMTRRVIE